MKRTFFFFALVTSLLVGWRLWLRAATTKLPGIAEIHARMGRPVRVEAPREESLRVEVSLPGQLEALVRVPAQFESEGRLQEVLVRVGDRVEAGQLLARLDSRAEKIAVREAEAALALSRAALAKAVAGPRRQELQAAQASLDEARASFSVARDELARSQRLRSERATSQQQLDRSQGGFDAAKARLDRAQETLGLLQEGTREEDLEAARAQVAVAEANLAQARLDLEKRQLLSPSSGTVVEVPAEPGEVIRNMPSPRTILEIEVQEPILFVAAVSELFTPLLGPESELDLTVDALPGPTFRGRVHEISPSGDQQSRTFRVEFAVPNPSRSLRPGMFARGKLVTEDSGTLPTVPAYVLRSPESLEIQQDAPPETLPTPLPESAPGERALVMVVAGGRATARLVRVALRAQGRAAIAAGLEPGDQVIVEGFEDIPAGMRVRPLGASESQEVRP